MTFSLAIAAFVAMIVLGTQQIVNGVSGIRAAIKQKKEESEKET